jgi:predicted ATPase/class 3 adenylate cyclase/tetratricopeptide (TPR) repeat protein
MAELPSGTVTFLFSDVEGSTQLLERHGPAMGSALARHHELFAQIISVHQGAIFETVGDAVYAAFERPSDAVAAAVDAHLELASEDWGPIGRLAVRIAVHTGEVELRGDHYFGPALFRTARLQALGYGEQTLISGTTAALVRDALPVGTSLRDLGTHRLKDLGEPERVFMPIHPRLRDVFPPPKSLDLHPNNLPVQLSSFVGRTDELVTVEALIDQHRLVTLTGAGGSGKTRLALQAAGEVIDVFRDGVFLVELAPVRDTSLVASTIASTLGVKERPGGSTAEALTDFLALWQGLLVVDNFEQIVEAAPLVADLLSQCANLKVLATSRAPLRVRGEYEHVVLPLEVPDLSRQPTLESLNHSAAVQLFVERARQANEDFAVTEENARAIAEICVRLDGLPLAIELAAARVKLLGPVAMLARFEQRLPVLNEGARDLPERQRTLTRTILWSYDLLTEETQHVFVRLSVFVGSFTLDAAVAVCELESSLAVLDAVSALADESLLREVASPTGETRWHMLETVREFALDAAGQDAKYGQIRANHAAFYCDLAVEAEPFVRRSDPSWLRRLDADYENVRTALDWALGRDPQGVGLRLSASLWRYWSLRGRVIEGRRWVEMMLASHSEMSGTLRASALVAAGVLAEDHGDMVAAELRLQEALALFRRQNDSAGMAWCYDNLGKVAVFRGDTHSAARRLLRGLVLASRSHAEMTKSSLLANLSLVAYECGDTQRGDDLVHEALDQFRALGDYRAAGIALGNLGWVTGAMRGDVPGAMRLLEESAAAFDQIEAADYKAWALGLMAQVYVVANDHESARRVLIESAKLIKAQVNRTDQADAIDAWGSVLSAEGLLVPAIRLWGTAQAIRESQGGGGMSVEFAARSRGMEKVRDAVGAKRFARAFHEGRGIDFADAYDVALATSQKANRKAAGGLSAPD